MEGKQYHKHISSEHKLFDLKLKEVFQYKDLIWMFTKRTFQVSYKQTILGPLWLFINPLMTSVVYVILFGNIAKLSTDGAPQLLFYLAGNAIWSYFSSNLSGNSSTFTSNAGLFGKVYFPRLTVPISGMFSYAIKFAIQMILVLILIGYYCITGTLHPNWIEWLLIPVLLLQLGLMGIGIGIILSSMTTKYRDLSVLVGFGVTLWMYATPVVYPLSQLNDGIIRTILIINPVTAPVELFRHAILGTGTVLPGCLAISWAFTVAVLFIGIIIFNKVERNFMDTV